jgi:hypothetical protein
MGHNDLVTYGAPFLGLAFTDGQVTSRNERVLEC